MLKRSIVWPGNGPTKNSCSAGTLRERKREWATTDRVCLCVCVGECERVLKFLWVISSSCCHCSNVALSRSLFALLACGIFHVLCSCQLSQRVLASSVIFIISYDLIIDYCFECVRACVDTFIETSRAESSSLASAFSGSCNPTNVAGNCENCELARLTTCSSAVAKAPRVLYKQI